MAEWIKRVPQFIHLVALSQEWIQILDSALLFNWPVWMVFHWKIEAFLHNSIDISHCDNYNVLMGRNTTKRIQEIRNHNGFVVLSKYWFWKITSLVSMKLEWRDQGMALGCQAQCLWLHPQMCLAGGLSTITVVCIAHETGSIHQSKLSKTFMSENCW